MFISFNRKVMPKSISLMNAKLKSPFVKIPCGRFLQIFVHTKYAQGLRKNWPRPISSRLSRVALTAFSSGVVVGLGFDGFGFERICEEEGGIVEI